MTRELTTKQRRFVEAYAGNGTEAARLARHKGNDDTLRQVAAENLAKPHIAEAIQRRQEVEEQPLIADRQRRQEFWSGIMLDNGEDMRARLRASELLGRSEGDFIDRHEHSGSDGGAILIDAIERGRRVASLVSLAQARKDAALADGEADEDA